MVEWIGLAFNGLWVLGAAVILAAFSFSYYKAQGWGKQLRVQLTASGFQLPFTIGLVLISLGAALIGPRWWERGLWGVLCAMSTWQLRTTWREWRTGGD